MNEANTYIHRILNHPKLWLGLPREYTIMLGFAAAFTVAFANNIYISLLMFFIWAMLVAIYRLDSRYMPIMARQIKFNVQNYYRRLQEYLPWLTLARSGTVIEGKDGGWLSAIRFTGANAMMSAEERDDVCQILSNLIAKLGKGYTVQIRCHRRPATQFVGALDNEMPLAVEINEVLLQEYYAKNTTNLRSINYIIISTTLGTGLFAQGGGLARRSKQFVSWLATGSKKIVGTNSTPDYAEFTNTVRQFAKKLEGVVNDPVILKSNSLLNLLSSCASPCSLAETENIEDLKLNAPVHLISEYVAPENVDMSGSEILLRHKSPLITYLAVFTIKDYPLYGKQTLWPDRFPFECMIVQNIRCLSRDVLNLHIQRNVFSRKQSNLGATAISEQDEISHLRDSSEAGVQFAEQSQTILIWAKSTDEQKALRELEIKQRWLEEISIAHGNVLIRETNDSALSYLGTLPGTFIADPKTYKMQLSAACNMSPIFVGYSGKLHNILDTEVVPPLLWMVSDGGTPFHFSPRQENNASGHTIVLGPTGGGKSYLLNAVALNWLKYPDAKVVCIDQGGSNRVLCHALNGLYVDLSKINDSGKYGIHPLRHIDTSDDKENALNWIMCLFEDAQIPLPAEASPKISAALEKLAMFPQEKRTLGIFDMLCHSEAVRAALRNYTHGALSGIFNPPGNLSDAFDNKLIVFEMGDTMNNKSISRPMLRWLFRTAWRSLKGHNGLFVVDELYSFLQDNYFAKNFNLTMKQARKDNISIFAATQAVGDIYGNAEIAGAINGIENMILIPSPELNREEVRKALIDADIPKHALALLSTLQRRQDYMFFHVPTKLYRDAQLALQDASYIAHYLCAATSKSEQDKAQAILDQLQSTDDFLCEFLRYKKIDEELLNQISGIINSKIH